jgi:endogenous inhibitor of DNA gyrase (YacG/DUF329 family)
VVGNLKNRCPNCGNYGISKYVAYCPFCGYDLCGKPDDIPRRWIVDRYVGESDGTTHESHYASVSISERRAIGKPVKKVVTVDCPVCGSSSLMFNFSNGLFECVNLKCKRFGATLVGMIGYDNFVEVKMKFSDRLIKLISLDYDPDKKLIGECKTEDIKDLLSNIRVLKFSNTGVTDKRVVLDKPDQSNSSKVVASMVINYWITKGVPFDIASKIESVRAYKIRRNKANEVVFEYKLVDPMDDSFIDLLNKTR